MLHEPSLSEVSDGLWHTTHAENGPLDVAFSNGNRLFHVINSRARSVTAHALGADGSLSPLPSTGDQPIGLNGLAARRSNPRIPLITAGGGHVSAPSR